MTTPYSSYTVTAASPASAADAYRTAGSIQNTAGDSQAQAALESFGTTLSRAVDAAIATGRDADQKSVAAIEGHGNLTDVVTAVSKAELALQTTTAIRDRMVQAYQDVMKMPM